MRFLAFIGALAICVVLAGAVYFFGGFYAVAASDGGNAAVEWAVERVREASVRQHAQAPTRPDWFDDAKTVQAGAHEFAEEGCADCHGAPGRKPEKFAQGMDPKPPDLGHVVQHLSTAELFWVIKNGIRMTGMPAFGGHADDKEIWRAVAFIKRLGSVTPSQYEDWSGGGGETGEKADHGESRNRAPAPASEAHEH